MTSYKWPAEGGGSGSGDVVGPASSTDSAVALWDGTTGKLLKNSSVTVNPIGNVLTTGSVTCGSLAATTSVTGASMTATGTIQGATVNVTGLTASRAVVTDGSKNLASSATTATQVGYLSTTTSDVQVQIDAKAAGAASSTDTAIAKFSGTTGKILQNSGVTISASDVVSGATQLNVDNLRLDGNTVSSTNTNGNINLTPNGTGVVVADNIQTSGSSGIILKNSGGTQVVDFGPANTTNVTFAGNVNVNGLTANRAVVSGGTKTLTSSATTDTQIGYLSTTTSDVQTQLDAKQLRSTLTTKGDLYVATASNTVARQGVGTDGFVLTAKASETNGMEYAVPVPVGSVLPFAGTTAPSYYLICDGSAVSRTTYAALFTVIGEAYGEGDNSTTFNLPDLRGRFVRGRDGGAGRDPNAGTRTASGTNGNTGDNVGSIQDDAFESHNHSGSYYGTNGNSTGNGPYLAPVSATDAGTALGPATSNVVAQGGSETRPINIYLNYIIRF